MTSPSAFLYKYTPGSVGMVRILARRSMAQADADYSNSMERAPIVLQKGQNGASRPVLAGLRPKTDRDSFSVECFRFLESGRCAVDYRCAATTSANHQIPGREERGGGTSRGPGARASLRPCPHHRSGKCGL